MPAATPDLGADHRNAGPAPNRSAVPTDRVRHPSAMEHLARLLERSDAFKVLRRLDVRSTPLPECPEHRVALFVDVETTGTDAFADEIVELAALPFQYDGQGRVTATHEPLDMLRDPGRPIPAEVTRLTGIDDASVRGKAIDVPAFDSLRSRACLVVAHNASFDRAFLERFIPGFAAMPWACTMIDVPWREEGVTTLKLEALAAHAGFFYPAHRAADDCLAAVELLRRPLPLSGRHAMGELLRSARRATFRITAVKAPFERKDLLKRRNYRWRAPTVGDGPMAWTVDVPEEGLENEIAFLRRDVYGMRVDLPVRRITAFERYSSRV